MENNVVALNQGYDHSFQAREQLLIERLAHFDELIVSFSGRLESCYSIDLCRASGAKIRAITLDNPTRSRSEVARARRYCQHFGIEQWVIKTDEVIFCDRSPHVVVQIDPIRALLAHLQTHPEWSHLPLLLSGSVEERDDYLGKFGSLPANTIWFFADNGVMSRDFRYGFNKRQLDRWGKGSNGCLSNRFTSSRQLDPRYLRMVDQAEQMLADMELDEAQVFFHTLCDCSTILARVRLPEHQRAQAFDRQSDILSALKSTEFDLVTLDMAQQERHDLAI
ncbi:hypothetical protein ACTG15_06475 [Aeromonas sp. 164P]